MQDPPDKTVLLGAIAKLLATDVLPAIADPALGFRVRIAAHLVGVVAREASAEEAHDQAELDGLIALGLAEPASSASGVRAAIASGRARLAEALRTGAVTDQADGALVAALRDRLAVSNPKFSLDPTLGDDPWPAKRRPEGTASAEGRTSEATTAGRSAVEARRAPSNPADQRAEAGGEPAGVTDFLIGNELSALRARVRTFVDTEILPVEDRVIAEDQATGDSPTLAGLQAKARAAGLWTPHLPASHGGLGLGVMGMCALFREMGRSMVGARVFHCDAPDQGNMDLLLRAGSPAIQERWLQPLVDGAITSAFCMTEPAPGAGADPSNLRTRARWDGEQWVIDGHKWYSTGAGTSAFLIVMARTSDDPRTGATLFVVDRHAPGVTHVRDIPVMGPPLLAHREAELRFDGVRVGADAVLGGEGRGFELAQARLVPARLTHCMRWSGLAARTLELCRDYLGTRRSFGRVLADHQLVQRKIAANAAAIHAGNLMTLHCAQLLESGDTSAARPYSSMAKTHVARTLCQVLDDAIQLHGSLGYSEDVPFSLWYRWARASRIADGPDEVHEMVVARDFFKDRFALLV